MEAGRVDAKVALSVELCRIWGEELIPVPAEVCTRATEFGERACCESMHESTSNVGQGVSSSVNEFDPSSPLTATGESEYWFIHW